MLSKTQRFLDGLAERGLLGATVAVNYKSCGFVYEEVGQCGDFLPGQCCLVSMPG